MERSDMRHQDVRVSAGPITLWALRKALEVESCQPRHSPAPTPQKKQPEAEAPGCDGA